MSLIGQIVWQDLTVGDATSIRDFYSQVVGWEFTPQTMGDYDDYNVNLPESGDTVAGICHARGENAHLPPQWLLYVKVADVAQSILACEAGGGKVIAGIRMMGKYRFCVIQDPAGAVLALISD